MTKQSCRGSHGQIIIVIVIIIIIIIVIIIIIKNDGMECKNIVWFYGYFFLHSALKQLLLESLSKIIEQQPK